MLVKLTNGERKVIFGKKFKAERERIQASIDACKARRAENGIKRQGLAEAQEKLRLQQLANLRKKMVIIFCIIDGRIVILTIVDPSLLKFDNSVRMKHHITYGFPEYKKVHMNASYSLRGKKSESKNAYSYTVSTADGFNFDIIDTDGTTILSFETRIHYESLAGKSFSGVQFDQIFYDPFKDPFDDGTAKFHKELDRLIEADRLHIERNPELLSQ